MYFDLQPVLINLGSFVVGSGKTTANMHVLNGNEEKT